MLKRILGLSLIGVIALCLFAGTTWAAISDRADGTSNGLISGKLDLKPSIEGTYSGSASFLHVTSSGDQATNKVVLDKVAPGQSGTIKWVLENTGTVAGTLSISCSGTAYPYFTDGVAAVAPESLFGANNTDGNGDLDQYMKVTLQRGQGVDQTAAQGAYSYILGSAGSPVAISGLEAVLDAQSIALAASGGSDTLVYLLSWSLSNTEANINIVQGDTAEIDVTFTLSQ
jgi:hypothetical protein